MFTIDELFTKFQSYPRPDWMSPHTRELMYSLVLADIQSLSDDGMCLADLDSADPYILGLFTADEAEFIIESGAS